MDYIYVTIEGTIGVGKTTLAKALSSSMEADLVLEKFTNNPFLERFYNDKRRWAFTSQTFFLVDRVEEQIDLKRPLVNNIISDYDICKNNIFADIVLDRDEKLLYDRMFQIVQPKIRKPDLIIYLRCSIEEIQRRIAQRGRKMEQKIEAEYLELLTEKYDQLFNNNLLEVPTISLDTTNVNLVESEETVKEIITLIQSCINNHNSGVSFKECSYSNYNHENHKSRTTRHPKGI